ncbi:saccharopine dehydrogenase NADP-binding domain-containing protein [Congregibacter variabilis]|uniref:Saccharopine dehydrogenase NADP-binding domain-containing protein n=1 Tax=Congregibacter variabilis TaxID=3081200 RepID=A0ABZ0I5Z7_9GAMM|nr:saccharopine dehydrogenase NADP-binding domain-containing protein [Congregibacter sp. IMCC43200]
MPQKPRYEVLLYGATGFTGQLAAKYLAGHPDLAGKRWAIAGRNAEALDEVRQSLEHDQLELVVCPLDDEAAVQAMVRSTQVVITTAGPYSSYNGEALLGACAKLGVHYSDLSGEGFWQREMIDSYHQTAIKSGAKIVLGGGVDSIPSDLGAYLALQACEGSIEDKEPIQLTAVYTEYSGSFSGGTLASGRARQAAIKSGRLTREAMHDPYVLAPNTVGADSETATLDGMPKRFRYQRVNGMGTLIPFFMAQINAPVVRRSLALAGVAETVSYRECCSIGMWARVAWLYSSRGLGFPLGEPINFNPKSGQGPPKWMLTQGQFTVEVHARSGSKKLSKVTISGKGDPGYGATSKMLSEVALCLLKEQKNKPDATGVLTPATALGDALVDRLSDAEGGRFMRFTVV